LIRLFHFVLTKIIVGLSGNLDRILFMSILSSWKYVSELNPLGTKSR
jgi:hypothetical protein